MMRIVFSCYKLRADDLSVERDEQSVETTVGPEGNRIGNRTRQS